jgi:hypothetical protein
MNPSLLPNEEKQLYAEHPKSEEHHLRISRAAGNTF